MTGFWLLYLTIFAACGGPEVQPGVVEGEEQTVVLGFYAQNGGPEGCSKAEDAVRAGGILSQNIECVYYQPPWNEEPLDDTIRVTPEWTPNDEEPLE